MPEQKKKIADTLTIFLADDDEDDQELLKEAFITINASINFHSAENGRQALHYLTNVPHTQLPCLIVLDYNMPELNGAEVLQVIVQEEKFTDVPKVIWTTSNSQTHREYCLSLGADDYLVKPDNMKDIEKMARKMLEYCKEGFDS